MLTLPSEYLTLIQTFEPIFSQRVWQHLQILVIGAILAPGKCTVTAVLRTMGLSQDKHFQNYHCILNRAVWSSREVSRILFTLLIMTFALVGDLGRSIDDTIERRRGEKIKARGIYRDPVRSSHGHFVKACGLRWLSLLLAPIPWAQRVWALPFLTTLAPSERYDQDRVREPKALIAWARQMLLQVRHWLPQRRIVIVADVSFAVLCCLGCNAWRTSSAWWSGFAWTRRCMNLPRRVADISRDARRAKANGCLHWSKCCKIATRFGKW